MNFAISNCFTSPSTTCPDRADAVDATMDVVVDGVEYAVEVTLVPDHTGKLSTWGDLDHWLADGPFLRLVRDMDKWDRGEVMGGIEYAVRVEAAALA